VSDKAKKWLKIGLMIVAALIFLRLSQQPPSTGDHNKSPQLTEKPEVTAKTSAVTPYPHVPKKNGSYDPRTNDLWELAQDWVYFRNKIIRLNAQGDAEGASSARKDFEQVNQYISQYREEDVSAAIAKAEALRGGR
jgi:hypothetical protein